jgi:hypothetical protein
MLYTLLFDTDTNMTFGKRTTVGVGDPGWGHALPRRSFQFQHTECIRWKILLPLAFHEAGCYATIRRLLVVLLKEFQAQKCFVDPIRVTLCVCVCMCVCVLACASFEMHTLMLRACSACLSSCIFAHLCLLLYIWICKFTKENMDVQNNILWTGCPSPCMCAYVCMQR